MINTFELRNKPFLSIKLDKEYIEVVDDARPTNNGKYLLININNFEFIKEETNWWFSIFIIFIDIFFRIGGSDFIYKDKPFIKFNSDNKKVEISLYKADIKQVEQFITLMKYKN